MPLTSLESNHRAPQASIATDLAKLRRFLGDKRRVFVLTGAGCSTPSGIPDYRDDDGGWKHKRPIQLQQFVGSVYTRQRYWARSRVGWERIRTARPNPAHHALAALEQWGAVHCLVTQNVDGLHQRAGSRKVIDLHGRLDEVECLACRARISRETFQRELVAQNAPGEGHAAWVAPDGDVDLGDYDYAAFNVPSCSACGGVLKPAVVFFGESVPASRVEHAYQELHQSDALLVVGSSLMVFSGFRFLRAAAKARIPIAILNRGKTRGDELAELRARGDCAELLPRLLGELSVQAG